MAGFEDRAADWIRFARAEGHDAYWLYRDAFFDLLPPSPRRVVFCVRAVARAPASHIRSRRRASSSGPTTTPPSSSTARTLPSSAYEPVSDRNGIRFAFASRRYPLEAYARALETAGRVIEKLRETPLPGVDSHRRTRIPLFLLWRARKPEARA